MQRIVTIKRGEVRQLADFFDVTPRTVYNALRGHTKGETTTKIRAVAIERGAVHLNQ